MKVLHVIPSLSPRDGGPSEAAIGMCRALESAGIDCLIATTDFDGPGRLNVPIGIETRFEDVRAIFFRSDLGKGFKYSRQLTSWLERHVREFDLVHIHAVFNHSSIAAARACRTAGVPYILRPAGTLDPWSLNRGRLRKRLFLATFGRRTLLGAKSLHFTTELERTRTLSALGERPSFVLPLGVAAPDGAQRAGEPAAAIAPPYVLFLSRIASKKNVPALIEGFARVLTPVPSPQVVERGVREDGVRMADGLLAGWKLVIAGSGDASDVDALHRLAAKLGVADRVIFTGWLDGGRKREILSGASLFTLPSLHENFGIAVAEAMAAGVPVLVSPGVALAAEVEQAEAGWVVEPTAASIAEGLKAILADGGELKRRGENGKRFASENFRWDRIAERLIEVYRPLTPSLSRSGEGGEVRPSRVREA